MFAREEERKNTKQNSVPIPCVANWTLDETPLICLKRRSDLSLDGPMQKQLSGMKKKLRDSSKVPDQEWPVDYK